jgi:uncharacterized membrane protein YgdD (TMEM256/DUF423 family)
MSITIVSGSSGSAQDRRVRLSVWVGVIILGLSVAVGVFIQAQFRDPSPPEDVPRALAIPALYAAIGLLAIIAAIQRRPTVVIATGVLCFVGSILSIATLEFVVPGIALVALGSRIEGHPGRRRREVAIACAATLLVIGAGVGLLSTTESRCWTAAGSPADPHYTVVPCGSQTVIPADGGTFASGFDSGVLTARGGLIEAVLLAGALGIVTLTGRGWGTKRVPASGADGPET